MNEYAKCLYDYLIENSCRRLLVTPAYRSASGASIQEERALLQMLTPEQQEQFSRYQKQESELEEINLQYVFMETLRIARGLFFPG